MAIFCGSGDIQTSNHLHRKLFTIGLAFILLCGGTRPSSFGQDAASTSKNLTSPADWPWKTWQRNAAGVERWQELDVDGIEVWRQSTEGIERSIAGGTAFEVPVKGTVFFAVAPKDMSADNGQTRNQIELPRLDNVVERVWWWPLDKEFSDASSRDVNLIGDAYLMPFVPSQTRLMKLAQTPTRWTISYGDSAAANRAMAGGGVVVMDVRGEPKWNVDAEVINAGKDGVIVLPASKAKVFGKQLQFEPLPHKNTVGYWVNADDYATWKVAVASSGEYQVQLLQGCGNGQGGSRIALSFGDAVLETLVEETGHFQNFRWRDLGAVTLQAGTDIDVSLRCLAKAKAAVMDVRQVRLVPVQTQQPSGVREIDVRQVAVDVDLPPLTREPPAPGRRSIRQAAIVETSHAYHLLSLPTDWTPSRRYPVLVEWTGNGPFENDRGDRSTGRVEDAHLAYGLSGGDGWIVLTLPFLNEAGTANVSKWWGDAPEYRPDSTLEYAKAAIDEVCEQFGGERSRLILVGFSRGSIACNAVGLANDDVAAWWRGFVCCSHYDGVRRWPPTGDEAASLRRLARLGNRPQLIVSETSTPGSISNVQETSQYFKRNSINTENLSVTENGFVNHSDGWALRPNPARTQARKWLSDVLAD